MANLSSDGQRNAILLLRVVEKTLVPLTRVSSDERSYFSLLFSEKKSKNKLISIQQDGWLSNGNMLQKLNGCSLFWRLGELNAMMRCLQSPGLRIPRPQDLLLRGFWEVCQFP